jgi:hypothetical protein
MTTKRRKARRIPETQIRLREILDEIRLMRADVDAIRAATVPPGFFPFDIHSADREEWARKYGHNA